MAKSRKVGTAQSLLIFNALLMTTALSLPASAQVETVVVTAERKSADIQTVPVSVTALTGKDLKAKQVTNFRDLQFHVPSVTYTKSNFGGAQFQIRGITTQFGLGAAIAQNEDDVYFEAPALVTGEYYDVDRVEVLRGPQSTSYGRAATGGAVNIITTKPDLDDFAARLAVDYGSFGTVKPDAFVNIPIIGGELAVRAAVHASFHEGYERNIYSQLTNGQVNFTGAGAPPPNSTLGQTTDIFKNARPGPAENRGNSLGIMGGRLSTRWQPSDSTTVDLIAEVGWENDRRVRGDKQECHFDPAGIIGCLPDRLGFQGFNTAATLGTSLGSAQGIAAALSGAVCLGGVVQGAGLPAGGGCGNVLPTPLDLSAAQLIGNTIGLCSIAGNGGPGDPAGAAGLQYLGSRLAPAGAGHAVAVVPQTPEVVGGPCTGGFKIPGGNTGGGGFVSQDILTTNTAFNPKYKGYAGAYLLNWSQTITDWLKMTVDGGFIDGGQFTQQDFTDATHENINTQIKQAQDGFDIVFGGPGHGAGPGNYPGIGGFSGSAALLADCLLLPAALQAACTSGVNMIPSAGAIATNAPQYDAVYFDQYGQLPVSNTHYNSGRFANDGGIIDTSHCPGSPKGSGVQPFGNACGILLKSPQVIAYDEDWFYGKEWTGEARFQTSFQGPLNFSAGLFYMDFVSENQYWVAANSLDWESAVLGAFLTPCSSGTCSATPYLLAMPDFDAEYTRGLVESRSAFLEGTYEITDELKVIAGARFNDDRNSYFRASKCAGGGLFAVNAANPIPDAGGPCDGTQFIQPDPGAPTASDPHGTPPKNDHDTNFAAGLTSLYPIGSTGVLLPHNTRVPTFLTGKGAQTTDLWTGRVSINWSPKLDFTDQTFVYFTASKGELAGGINAPNNAAQTIVPVVYKAAEVNALEFGVKNTLLDNTLTANLTAWYYNYANYQVVVIANRQALELNIPAHLDGLEGEFLWQPTGDIAFNLTLSATQSAAGHVHVADERNPTNNVPGSILVRDITNGSICVVVPMAHGIVAAAPIGSTPGDSNGSVHVANFYLPNGGDSTIDAGFGIPLVNYGICGGQGSPAQTGLEAKGFEYAPAVNPRTGGPVFDPVTHAQIFDGTGFARDLHGNRLPQVPFGQVGVGAQYTFHWEDFNIVPRVDYYWQSSMESRVWNDPVIDRINSWDVMNMSLNLNETDSKWTFQMFAKNVFDKHNPTGQYLQDPAAGTYTNVFSEDPRVFGFSIGDTF